MDPLATVDQFQARLGRELADGSADLTRAEAILDDVSAEVIQVAGGITTWTGDDIPPVIVGLVCNVAKRVFLNPAGYTSETVGEWTGRYEDGVTGMYLTDEEKRIVRRAAGINGLGRLVISRYPELHSDTNYVDVFPPGKPLPVDYP